MKKVILISLFVIVLIICGASGILKLNSNKVTNNNIISSNPNFEQPNSPQTDEKIYSQEIINSEQIEEYKRILTDNIWQIKEITTESGKEVSLLDAFGSGINVSMGSLKFLKDGTFENIPPSIYGEVDIDGNYYITEDGKVILDYDGQYKEIGEFSYGGESPTILVFDAIQNSSAEIYTDGQKCKYIFANVERQIINYEVQEKNTNEICDSKTLKNSLDNAEDILGIINKEKSSIEIELNGDGQKDRVDFLGANAIKINGITYEDKYYEKEFENGSAWISNYFYNTEILFVDFNKNDKCIEFVVRDNSLSEANGFCYGVYSFDGTNLKKLFDLGTYGVWWDSENGIIGATPNIISYLSEGELTSNLGPAVWYQVENASTTRYISEMFLKNNRFICKSASFYPWNIYCIDVNSNEEIEFLNKKFQVKNIISEKLKLKNGTETQCFNEYVNPPKVLIEFDDGIKAYLQMHSSV